MALSELITLRKHLDSLLYQNQSREERLRELQTTLHNLEASNETALVFQATLTSVKALSPKATYRETGHKKKLEQLQGMIRQAEDRCGIEDQERESIVLMHQEAVNALFIWKERMQELKTVYTKLVKHQEDLKSTEFVASTHQTLATNLIFHAKLDAEIQRKMTKESIADQQSAKKLAAKKTEVAQEQSQFRKMKLVTETERRKRFLQTLLTEVENAKTQKEKEANCSLSLSQYQTGFTRINE
jgi:hypothetical protein